MDGSKFSNGKTAEIKVQFSYEKPPKTADQEIIDLLGEVVGKPIPLSFFAVQGKQTTDGYSFENSRGFFLVLASATHAKTVELTAKGSELIATPRRRKRCCNQPSRQRTAGITRTSKEQRLSLDFCGTWMIVVRSM